MVGRKRSGSSTKNSAKSPDGAFRFSSSLQKEYQRRIDGKRFIGSGIISNKQYARKVAEAVRTRTNRNARVIPNSKGFRIYVGPNRAQISKPFQSISKPSFPVTYMKKKGRQETDCTSMQGGVSCIRCGRTPPYWTDTRIKTCGRCCREEKEAKQYNKEIKTPELSGLRRNIMGTTSFTLKGGSMRKPQEFIIYPKNENDGLPPYIFQIQSDTRIGLIDMKNGGRMLATPPVSSGAYGVHLQFALENKTAQSLGTLEKSDYEALFDAIGATANTWGDRTEVITTDNTGAGLDFLNSVKDSGLE